MLRPLSTVVVAGLMLVTNVQLSAHNVWCHCSKKDKLTTMKFFYQAGAVYEALSDALGTWHSANSPLEKGVLAEFERAINGAPLKPYHYRETLHALTALQVKLEVLHIALGQLRELSADGTTTPEFDAALSKLLAEGPRVNRLSTAGVRYADSAGREQPTMPIVGITGVIDAQITDLRILRSVLDQVVVGLRDALPLADRGEFARVMLSGRNAFGDKMPQLTDMVSAYDRLYVQTCMATIAATMQVYPKGFEWLGR